MSSLKGNVVEKLYKIGLWSLLNFTVLRCLVEELQILKLGIVKISMVNLKQLVAGPKIDLNGLREGLRELGFIFT